MAASNDLYGELDSLRSENQQLAEELSQCQADKEFVWSLWKRLQVANPDITQAISLVVQREKEKAEIKDRKVLEILQIKDTKIDELQNALAARSHENSSLVQRRVDFQSSMSRLEEDNRNLQDKVSILTEQLKNRENREQSLEELQKQIIQNQEKDRSEFSKEVSRLQSELTRITSEKNELLAIKIQQENTIEILQKTDQTADIQLKECRHNLTQCETDKRKYEHDIKKHRKEIDGKNKELESVRKELSDMWEGHKQCGDHAAEQAKLVHQLKQLQEDTEKIVANQEDAYKMETSSLQTMYDELSQQLHQLKDLEVVQRRQLSELKQQLSTRDGMIHDLEERLETALRQADSSPRKLRDSSLEDEEVRDKHMVASLEHNVENLKEEILYLREKLKDRNRVINQLDRRHSLDDLDLSRISTRSRDHAPPARPHIRCKSAPVIAKPSSTVELQKKLAATEQKLEGTKDLLELKKSELKTLHCAHLRRLDRLRALQGNYRLVREQLKTAEEELHGPKPRKKKLLRPAPKLLQKEQNTESLWNELTHFKNENKNLMVEKMNLEEELDTLRVKESQDTATIHELKLCLEQEKEELEYLLKKQEAKEKNSISKDKLLQEKDELNMKIKDQLITITKLEDKLTRLIEENERLREDKRQFRSEMNSLKQTESQKRIETADLKAEITRLERRLERQRTQATSRNKSNNHRRVRSASPRKSSPLVKKYKRKLNQSIERMSVIFDDFNDNDWEELSEEEHTESDTCESDIDSARSLGKQIVFSATGRHPVTSSPKKPMSPLIELSPVSDVGSSSDNRKDTRDMATSPIKVGVPGGQVNKRKPTYSVSGSGGTAQVGPLKQRLGSLQAQVNALRIERSSTSKNAAELRQQNEQLQVELNAANQRAKMNRQNIQKLSSEVEKLQFEKEDVDRQLAMKVHVPEREQDQRNTQEWQRMEQRLKASQAEVSRQSAVNRGLREDNVAYEDQISALRDKMNRLERDISQKRILLDDLKLKLKLSQQNARSEILSMGDLEGKAKSLTETCDRLKTQNKSLEKRLMVVTKEKKDYEESYYNLSSDFERKSKLLTDCQHKKSELETALADVEHTAKEQLRSLANQSEAAVEAAQTKIHDSHALITELQNFVKTLSLEILRGVQNARLLVRQQRNRVKSEAKRRAHQELAKAQDVAKNILNISQDELDELMDEEEQEKEEFENDLARRKDKKWSKRWERLLASKKDFALPLVEIMMEKVEERVQLMNRLRG